MLYESILSNFNEKLNEIQLTNSNFLDQANLGYIICTKTLGFLRKTIEKNSFKNLKKEIHFFKNVKVEPMQYLIYYTEVRSCELSMPKIGSLHQMGFLEK